MLILSWMIHAIRLHQHVANQVLIKMSSQTRQRRKSWQNVCYLFCFFHVPFFKLVATNKYEQTSEQAVKRAMQSIMIGKSVIYTKTDLTMLCNKQNIRLDAVERLVDAKLLKYGDKLWVEPTRAKTTNKKDPKPILRPGWLKYEQPSMIYVTCSSFL